MSQVKTVALAAGRDKIALPQIDFEAAPLLLGGGCEVVVGWLGPIDLVGSALSLLRSRGERFSRTVSPPAGRMG